MDQLKEKYNAWELMAYLWWFKFSSDEKFRMFIDAFGNKTDWRFPDGSHLIYLMSVYGDNENLKGFPKPSDRYFTCCPDQFFENEVVPFVKMNPIKY